MYSASTMLYPTLADSVFGPSYAPQHAPFSKFYDGRTFFDFVHNVEPWRGERFNRGMMAVNQSHGMKSMIQGVCCSGDTYRLLTFSAYRLSVEKSLFRNDGL